MLAKDLKNNLEKRQRTLIKILIKN